MGSGIQAIYGPALTFLSPKSESADLNSIKSNKRSSIQELRGCSDIEDMRLLALFFSIQICCLSATGNGDYESLIHQEPSLEKKVAIAKKAFASIEGFVAREMFMSYWSIDVLGEVAPEFERRIQSDGIQSLLPDYNLIKRICALEMGDFRYFLADLKSELEKLISQFYSASGSKPSKLLPFEDHSIGSVWDEKLIAYLVEVWIAMGYGEGIGEEAIEALLANNTWEAEDVEYWQELIYLFDGNPAAILKSLAWRRFTGDLVGRYLELYEFEGALTELNIDRVSDVGPRLY